MLTYIKKLNRCDFYICINCLFSLQGYLYPQGIINQFLQLIILVWSLHEVWKIILSEKTIPPLLRRLNLLVVLFSFYGILALMIGYYGNFTGRPKYLYLQRTLTSLLPIYVYYHYAIKGYLKESHIRIYLFPLLLVAIVNYYKDLNEMILESLSGRVEFTMNVGYEFLSLVPIICMYYKRPLIQYLFMLFLMYWIVICMKRGAMLIGIICALYFLWNTVKNTSSLKKIVSLAMATATMYLGYRFFLSMLANSDYFLLRYESTLEGNSSGRDEIYSNLLSGMLENFNLFEWMFGRGGYSTFSVAGEMAHNDWLEILCNNGIIGLIIFSMFMLSFFNTVKNSRKNVSNYLYVSFFMVFFITLVRTLISQSIMVLTDVQTMMIGYCIYITYSQGLQNQYRLANN